MNDVWSERADAYRTSTTHMRGDDLEALVVMCEPAEGAKALDVATGGGHVARRLREEGCEVVTIDSSPEERFKTHQRCEKQEGGGRSRPEPAQNRDAGRKTGRKDRSHRAADHESLHGRQPRGAAFAVRGLENPVSGKRFGQREEITQSDRH